MKNLLVGAILICAPLACFANSESERGWYIGGGFGSSNIELDPGFDPNFVNTDVTNNTFVIYGGYNFFSWFGLEADYSYSGDFRDANSNERVYLAGASIMPKFTLELNENVSLYAKIGAQFYSYDQENDSSDETQFVGGETAAAIGAQFQFNSGVGLRVEYKYADMELENDDYFDSDYFDIWDDKMDLTLHQFSGSVYYSF